MADLDEMSLILGEIRGDVKHMLTWQSDHEVNDQRRFDSLTQRINSYRGHDDRILNLEADSESMLVITGNLTKMGWMSRGFVLALSLIGGASGAMALHVVKWF